MSPCHSNQLGGKGKATYRHTLLLACLFPLFLTAVTSAQEPLPKQPRPSVARRSVPAAVLLRIVRAEDERRWDSDLSMLLTNVDPRTRCRAALAAGRIGDERAVAP